MKNKFKGLYTAIITPFRNDDIDYVCLNKILEHQDKSYIDGLVVCGTTGEGPSLSILEKENLFNFTRSFYKNRKVLIAGISSYSAKFALEEARIARKCGMDALLVPPPVFLKTNSQGIEYFFKALIDNTLLPSIIYNVPSRTGYSLDIGVLERLSKLEFIISVKECSGDFQYVTQIKKNTPFSILCGDDMLYLHYLINGADGIISVVSNLLPEHIFKMREYFCNNKIARSQKLFLDLYDFMKILFSEPNPLGIKIAMASNGFCNEDFRLPLTNSINSKFKAQILKLYKQIHKFIPK